MNQGTEAGSADKPVIGKEIVKGPNPHVIPAAEDLLFLFIIKNKNKIADQMIDAVFLPFEVAVQDEFGVADTICIRSG